MRGVEPPLLPPGDELDARLRAFLRSQLPQPWPPARLLSTVASAQRRPSNGRELMRSRWALAASVALLLFGSWFLPSRFISDAKPEHGPNGPMISNIPPDAPKKHRKQSQIENKNKTGLAADEDAPFPELEQSDVPMLR